MNSLRTLLWLAIAICCTAAGLSAQPTFQMSPSTVSVDAGKTFSLDLVVQNFGSVKAFSFPVKWDPAVLQLESVSNPYASLTNFDPSEGMASGSISQGILVVIWQHPSLQTVNVPNGTSLFKLNFKAKIAGSSAVTVNRTTSFVEIINANDADIAANAVFQPASVTVKSTTDDSVVNPNDPIVIDLGAVSGPTGNTVCVPVKVSKFKRMENFQFSIHYDPALLEFAHVKNYNLADLDTASFSLPTNPNLGPGTLIVGWNNNSGASNGVSVVDGTTIFELCFLLKGPGGSNTNITINGNPLKIEVTRKDQPGVNVGLTPTGGLATITGNSGALEKVTLTAGSATGLPGADICVDIKVKGLSNTKSLGLSISWTAGVLTYKGVSGFGLTGLDASDFSVSGNKLTVNWSAA